MNFINHLENILFLDIETVPQTYLFHELDETSKLLFAAKNNFNVQKKIDEDKLGTKTNEEILEEVYREKGGILAEFGQIVCISVGFVQSSTTQGRIMHIKSFAHEDEETLLKQFVRLLEDNYNQTKHVLCGHNAKEFDFPYICRRLLIHGIKLPALLNIAGKKPWEINHLDTMELWKFGDYKAYTSLALLCHVFGVPTPKSDISGADVARVYYEEKDLKRIAVYCEKDVVALIQLFLKMHGESMIKEERISIR